jgi:hypothetical protein
MGTFRVEADDTTGFAVAPSFAYPVSVDVSVPLLAPHIGFVKERQ